MSVTIRNFRDEDLPTLKAITVEAFDGVSIDQGIEQLFGIINGRDWRWRKSRHLDVDLTREAIAIFVAEADGRIVGYVTTAQDRQAGIGLVSNLAIAGGYRGQGIGRQLLLHGMAHLRAAGMTHAKIDTVLQNEAGIHLYTDVGFREVARQVHMLTRL